MKPKHQSQWHVILISIDADPHGRYRECKDWCEQQFGRQIDILDNRQGVWSSFWAGPGRNDTYRFTFRDETDAVLFALRWS
jgi:hypothetical protein